MIVARACSAEKEFLGDGRLRVHVASATGAPSLSNTAAVDPSFQSGGVSDAQWTRSTTKYRALRVPLCGRSTRCLRSHRQSPPSGASPRVSREAACAFHLNRNQGLAAPRSFSLAGLSLRQKKRTWPAP